jgi:TetR/AcrR family transcriptional regulator, tetracycline repressor protein
MSSRSQSPPNDSHWLLRKDHARRRIDGGTIVGAAHDLVHEGGSLALTMRTLARELGTSTSALYRHIPSKEWLLIAIVDYVLAEVDMSATYQADDAPRGRLERLSAALREVLICHPHVHEILASHVAVTPNTVRLAEAGLTCLRALGISSNDLIDAYNAWCGYVIGFTAIEVKPPESDSDRDLRGAMRSQLRNTDPVDHPIVTEMLLDVANHAYGLSWKQAKLGVGGTSFEWGLTALLDGFERRKRPRGR